MAERKTRAKTGQKKASTKKPAESRSRNTQKYIRNIHNSPVSVRFERHEPGKRRIELKPRGERGDLAPVQKEDFNDPVFQANANLLYEVITADEASKIIEKQTTNRQASHPALSSLRNELGEEYAEDAVKVAEVYEDQGTVVARLENGEVVVDRGGIRRRGPGEAPGTPAGTAGAEPGVAPANEDAAYLSDLRAREKNAEGPAAGLGGIQNVSVDPVQKT